MDIVDLVSEETVKVKSFASLPISWIEFSPDSKHLLIASVGTPVFFNYSLQLKESKPHLRVPGTGIPHFNVSLDGEQIAIVYTDGLSPANIAGIPARTPTQNP